MSSPDKGTVSVTEGFNLQARIQEFQNKTCDLIDKHVDFFVWSVQQIKEENCISNNKIKSSRDKNRRYKVKGSGQWMVLVKMSLSGNSPFIF